MKSAVLYDLPIIDIAREFFFNIGGSKGIMLWGVILLALLAAVKAALSLFYRVKIWRSGQGVNRRDFPGKRILTVIKYILFQAKIIREPFPGIMHASLFLGFAGLFFVSVILIFQNYFTDLFFHWKFINGNFYLVWSFLAECLGLLILLGLILAFYRRYVMRPSRLDTNKNDTFILIIILFIVISGFTVEALRIALSGFPAYEQWSFSGYALAQIFSWMGTGVLETSHYFVWWLHILSAFAFIGLISFGKIGHILISSLNIYFLNLDNEKPETRYAGNIHSSSGIEGIRDYGNGCVEDFTWKDLMDLDACTGCGRCQDNCPAWITEKPLSPKKIIKDLKDNMDERIPKLLRAEDPSLIQSKKLAGESVLLDEIWACTNCAACMENCPVQIEHVPKINRMRRYKVLKDNEMPDELRNVFININTKLNPYGFEPALRNDWIPDGLNVINVQDREEVDYLYFVGCASSFNDRNKNTAVSLVRILQKAGYSVGVLGEQEVCCGDAALRSGNTDLFRSLAFKNLEKFKSNNITKIITSCPHCYNVLKKEYPRLYESMNSTGSMSNWYSFKVFHHTEVINDLIRNDRISLQDSFDETITYHDSCFLGRYNEIYKEPREILKKIPGLRYVEMSRHHKKSFCCGAGGGRIWLEEKIGTMINQFRAKDAYASGAAGIGTACPFCLTKLYDGALDLNIQNLKAYDVAELVYNSMGK